MREIHHPEAQACKYRPAGRTEVRHRRRALTLTKDRGTRSSRPIWLGKDNRTWDHVRIHLGAIKDPRLGPYHFATYAALVAHAELETGEARPSVETIKSYYKGPEDKSKPGGISERTVRLCLRDLEQWAYIRVEHRSGQASLYFVLQPPTPAGDAGVEDETPAAPAAARGSRRRTTPAGPADEQEPLNKSPKQEARARDFATFWQGYPARHGRKLAKGKAEEAWNRLKPDECQLALLGVRQYARACTSGETLAKDAFRWLRDKSFEDWQPTLSVYQQQPTGQDPPKCEHGIPTWAVCEDCGRGVSRAV